MYRLVAVLPLVTACGVTRAPPRQSSVVEATVPAGCSPMHGGIPGSSPQASSWRRGLPRPQTLGDSTTITIQVVSATDGSPLGQAMVGFLANETDVLSRGVTTDDAGYATARVRVGLSLARVYRLGFTRYTESVTVRAHFADTLRLGLGAQTICFM